MQAQLTRPVAPAWPLIAVAMLAVLGLLILAFDQGQTLAIVQGDTAYQMNFIHELVHDARHAAGFPCH